MNALLPTGPMTIAVETLKWRVEGDQVITVTSNGHKLVSENHYNNKFKVVKSQQRGACRNKN